MNTILRAPEELSQQLAGYSRDYQQLINLLQAGTQVECYDGNYYRRYFVLYNSIRRKYIVDDWTTDATVDLQTYGTREFILFCERQRLRFWPEPEPKPEPEPGTVTTPNIESYLVMVQLLTTGTINSVDCYDVNDNRYWVEFAADLNCFHLFRGGRRLTFSKEDLIDFCEFHNLHPVLPVPKPEPEATAEPEPEYLVREWLVQDQDGDFHELRYYPNRQAWACTPAGDIGAGLAHTYEFDLFEVFLDHCNSLGITVPDDFLLAAAPAAQAAIATIKARTAHGLKEYGNAVNPNNCGQGSIHEARDEAADLLVYLENIKAVRDRMAIAMCDLEALTNTSTMRSSPDSDLLSAAAVVIKLWREMAL